MPSNRIKLLISGFAPVKTGDLITVWADWVEVDTYIVCKLAITHILPEKQRKNPEQKYEALLEVYENKKIEQHYEILGNIIEYNRNVNLIGPAYMSILDKRYLDHLRISIQGQILLEAIEIIPLDEEQTLNPDEIKKHMEEQWQKTEAARESLYKGLKVTGGSEKKKNIRKLLFDKSD